MQYETHSRPDMDERPQWSPPREMPARDAGYAAPSEPVTAHVAAAPAPQPEAEPAAPPRRRSTVREPAPVFGTGEPMVTPMPAPQPAPIATAAEPAAVEDASKPRRTGWWAKRLLGGDKG